MPSIFGYWDLKGLGQASRLLLEYTGEKYQDDRYEINDEEPWKAEKAKNPHGLPFPNLPYYVDGEVKLTQSMAILCHLARKHGLHGNDDNERRQLDMLQGQCGDLQLWWATICYTDDQAAFATAKEANWPNVTNSVKLLSAYLAEKTWFLGERITYVDFLLYDLLTNYSEMETALLKDYGNLQAMLKRFEALPAIEAYMKTDKFIKRPLNGPEAMFGGK